MFCSKCNTKLSIGSKFCSACGEKLISETLENLNIGNEEQVNVKSRETTVGKIKQTFANKNVVGIILAFIVCIILVWGIAGLVNGSFSDNAYVYLSNDKYQLLTDIETGQGIEISSSRSESVRDEFVSFSPNGKYVYYYTKYDSSVGAGTLCRVQYSKLKENSGKNNNYIEIIDTNVSLGFTFVSDDSILYKSGTDSLYYYDEEPILIAEVVKKYYLDGKNVIYYTGNYTDGYQIYGTTLGNPDDKETIVSKCDNCSILDADNILYTKEDEAGTFTLYKVGYNKESEKLVENVSSFEWVEGKLYFAAYNGATLTLKDFVEDNCAEKDAIIEKPKKEDFQIPYYSYSNVTGSNLTIDQFDELYTSCTKPLYWYRSWFMYYSMDEAINMNWGENTESIRMATQRFIDKFGDRANEDGYILVTEDVREGLKEIQKYADSPEKEWQWMWLCYNKRESGTTTDYDKYNEAHEEWESASVRNMIREDLLSQERDYLLQTLYCYEDGKLQAICKDVVDVSFLDNTILLNTKDQVNGTINIENLTSIDDIYTILNVYSGNELNVLLADGTICKMSVRASETLTDAYATDYAKIYTTDKEVFINDANKVLYRGTVKRGTVDEFVIVSDNAEIAAVYEDTLYYVDGFYEYNYSDYCDLYSLEDGEVNCLAKDIISDFIIGYSDGVIVACTEYSAFSSFELTVFDKNGQTSIMGENVSLFYRVDKSMWLYIDDGDLYSYDGKEKKLLQIGVDGIWCKDYIEGYKLYNSYF